MHIHILSVSIYLNRLFILSWLAEIKETSSLFLFFFRQRHGRGAQSGNFSLLKGKWVRDGDYAAL